ncbi:LysE family translocator [Pseudomonas koreensis]
MPDFEQMWPMALLTALILIVPGPTNTLLLSAGLRLGLRRALPLVGAEAAGYSLSILLWGTLLLTLAAGRPWLIDGLKYLCALYLLWLAFKIWQSNTIKAGERHCSVSGVEVFIATLLNPKAFLFASTVFPLTAFQSTEQFTGYLVAFLLVLVPIGSLWACMGHLLTLSNAWSIHSGMFLRTAAVILILFSAAIAYSTVENEDILNKQALPGSTLRPMT